MCDTCGNSEHIEYLAAPGRRKLLFGGATLAAAPLFSGVATSAVAQDTESAPSLGESRVRAYGVASATSRFAAIEIPRRAVRENDVLIEILYCGICHSDIHAARDEWSANNYHVNYPSVPGHEIVGRVIGVGRSVSKFKVGDIAGIGCMVDSCGTCANCKADLENYCENGWSLVFNAPDKVSGGYNYGGFSDRIVIAEHFAIRIPPGINLAAAAPLLCAGITTFSPLRHWEIGAGVKFGVVGMGGLGHMAVKLAAERGADVTIFTTSPGKVDDAKRLGARDVVLWAEQGALDPLRNTFDAILSTVPVAYPMQPFMRLLKIDGTFVNVGALEPLHPLNGMTLQRRNFAGSVIGGIAETQQAVDYCAARNLLPEVQVIRPDEITVAFDRVKNKEARYRIVVDLAAGRQA
jgi:alcohol dehydrogenase (NADP+)